MVLPSRNDTQYKQRRRSSPVRSLAIVGSLLLCVWAFTTGRLIWSAAPQQGPLWRRGAATAATSVAVDKRRMPDGSWAPTLLVYVFSNTDPEYINNLRFFVQFGMAPDDGVTYIIVVQEAEGQPVGGQRAERVGCSSPAIMGVARPCQASRPASLARQLLHAASHAHCWC